MGAFLTRLAAAVTLVLVLFPYPGALAAGELTEQQRKEVQDLVRQTLREHPELVVEAIEALETRDRQASEAKAKDALTARREEIERDKLDVVRGNPQGDVTLVEFFDYRCPWCKAMTDRVAEVVTSDGKIRHVLKELPILGPQSTFASKAALAAVAQGKYTALHDRLMAHRGDFGEVTILDIAKEVGLDTDRLQKDMNNPEIEAKLKRNRALAEALAITGTPGFVIGPEILRGATDANGLKKLVAKARAG